VQDQMPVMGGFSPVSGDEAKPNNKQEQSHEDDRGGEVQFQRLSLGAPWPVSLGRKLAVT